MKKILLYLLLLIPAINIVAQNEIKLQDINCYNLGDGRYYCEERESKKPVEGKSRIIDGYTTQYMEAEFKGGIPSGSWKNYRYNVLREEMIYKDGRLEGKAVTLYEDGTIQEERNFKEGKPHGNFISYYPDGKIEKHKEYKDGKEDGVERTFNRQENLISDLLFANGKQIGKAYQKYSEYDRTAYYNNDGILDGEYSEIYHGGNVKVKGKYNNGKKTGTWEYGKKSGEKTKTEEYANDDKIKETTYYTNGSVNTVRELKNGKKHGYERKYNYEDGSLLSELYFSEGKQSSVNAGNEKNPGSLIKQTKQMSSNQGNFIKTFYEVNGKLEGEYTEQYTEGNKGMKAKGQYKNGLKVGLWVYENRSGKKIKEENYVNGKLNGKVTTFENDGKINKMFTYKEDVREGAYEHYQYGKLSEKGTYVNNRVEGKRTYYNISTGKPSSEEIIPHDSSDPRSYKEYYETGVLREEGSRRGGMLIERKSYFPNGKLRISEIGDAGKTKVLEEYDETGKKLR